MNISKRMLAKGMGALKYYMVIIFYIEDNYLAGVVVYVLLGCVVVVISLVFFTVFSVTDKSIYPWRSREQNSPCYLGNFYDTHDFWHLFASFALMMMAMVVVQVSNFFYNFQ